MARPSGEKTRCGGQWTEARFNTFIRSLLRSGTRKWGPIQQALKDARTRRGYYLCAECNEEVTATIKDEKGKRRKNAIVDHIKPITDPAIGFTNWHDYVENMFCEVENLQVLCLACHKKKCQEETDIATLRRRTEKEYAQQL